MGVGHLYLGKLRRGFAILLLGIFASVLFYGAMITAFFSIALVLGVAWLSFWLWQIYDAYKLTRRYNDAVEKTGKPPL